MDRREAFRAAVIKFVSPKWAFPDNDTFEVEGKFRTVREVCELVKDDDEALPDPTVGDLMWALHGDLRLIEKLGQSRTFATGSRCLLDLLNDRAANFQAKR